MKTIIFCVKEKQPRNKNPSFYAFNMVDYLQSLAVGGYCTIIRLRYHMVSLFSFRIYICMCICIERQCCPVTVWFSDFRDK